MLQSIRIRGYRSLREFRLKLGRVTVVTGGNGMGKSNVYRSLALLQRMAEGRFAEALASEGWHAQRPVGRQTPQRRTAEDLMGHQPQRFQVRHRMRHGRART
ncbi:MAG: hypothetical protein MUF86_12340 [Akkermansiaceae bacterium]|nr:hypothetical protein [Akkermansiaceae bacterium]